MAVLGRSNRANVGISTPSFKAAPPRVLRSLKNKISPLTKGLNSQSHTKSSLGPHLFYKFIPNKAIKIVATGCQI